MYTLLYLKWVTNKALLYSTGNSAQCYVAVWMGGESGREYICKYMVRKQQLEPDMKQQTSSKLGKVYVKAVYCHPAYLNSMQSISYEMLSLMKHKLESRLLGDITLWQKVKRN